MNNSINTIDEQIVLLRKEELTIKEIAKELSITYDKVRYVLDKNRLQEFKYQRECVCCGKRFETTRNTAKFCSESCRNKYNRKHRGHKQTCKQCEKIFYEYKKRNHCSNECRLKSLSKNRKPKEKYIPKPKHTEKCINCTKEYETHSSKSKYCSYECKYEWLVKQKTIHNIKCKECSKWFATTNYRRKYCSTNCSVRFEDRKKETMRRKRIKKNGRVDWEISIERLIKRDKGVCYLCKTQVNINVDTNDDYYPSIDHVIPIAKGGTHTWNNVKLAHRICNSYKSDEIKNENIRQLTLL